MTVTKGWIDFKHFVYLVGWTYILGHLTYMNYHVIQYLLQVNMFHAVVTILLTTALYPIYLIGILGIVKDWKREDTAYDKQKEDIVSSSSG